MSDTPTLTHGYTVTAEFCGFPEARAVVRQYGKFLSSHPTRAEAFAAIAERGGVRPWLYRGSYRLPHQSQQRGDDLTFATIAQHWGRSARAVRRTPEHIKELRDGTGPRAGLPYEYLVFMPNSGATSWTAFYDRDDFEAWMEAYGVELATSFEEVPDDFEVQPIDADDDDAVDPAQCGVCNRWWDDGVPTGWTPTPGGRCPFEYFHERQWPEPGESFTILLPADESDMAPLTQKGDDQ